MTNQQRIGQCDKTLAGNLEIASLLLAELYAFRKGSLLKLSLLGCRFVVKTHFASNPVTPKWPEHK